MFLLISNPTIRRLFMAQALYWSCAVICVLLATLIGLKLAPLKELASLPLALFVLGNLLALQPISRVMARYGRRTGFLLGAAAGVLGGLASAASLWLESFFLFCLSAMPIGAYQASAMYYRFAALETVELDLRGRAAAAVVGAGVVAAVIAPSLGSATRDLLTVPFAGAYLLVAAMALTGALTLSGLPVHKAPQAHSSKPSPTRWRELVKRPVIKAAILTTAIGHGLMTLVMNATPLAMHGEGMTLDASGTVIQWHMLGMFLPAFLAGPLVDRYGARAVACLGAVLLMISALTVVFRRRL
ncbi:MFS transporter, partial [Pseudomonas aeruginosa]|nr:MFS transporter [Pseudomonas aeruginosa]